MLIRSSLLYELGQYRKIILIFKVYFNKSDRTPAKQTAGRRQERIERIRADTFYSDSTPAKQTAGRRQERIEQIRADIAFSVFLREYSVYPCVIILRRVVNILFLICIFNF